MDIPEIGPGCILFWLCVKVVQVTHEGFLVKQMEELPAVELDRVYQVSRVVDCRNGRVFFVDRVLVCITLQVVCFTIKE